MYKRKTLKMINRLLFTFLIMTMSLQASWSEYKTLFVAEDGRVIDRVNGDITHSESIGYALYFAVKSGDMESFEKIYQWYKNNLKQNEFGLISWKWGKDKDGSWHVLDTNNASDGDLWIAYTNLLMYEKTKNSLYKTEALELMKNIKQHLVVKQAGLVYLLPAKQGFETRTTLEINLSYYLFFIFDKFSEYDEDTIWKELKHDGINLLYKARFTPLVLNADWISVDKNTSKVTYTRNNSFGFDAIRIPYNILKSDIKDKDRLLEPYRNYVDTMKLSGTIFGVSDLKSGTISIYNYSFAHLSIYNMLDKHFNKKKSFTADLNRLKGERKDDYYSYSIYLFTTFN